MTRDLDPDRRLALAYVPARIRPAIEALWRLDVTFAAILAGGGDRAIGRIRLAWWREALARLDEAPPPPEPVLRGIAAHLLVAGIAGAELAAMEEGWTILLAERPLAAAELDDYAALRGGTLFRLSARLLGDPGFPVEEPGKLWALADLARHNRSAEEVRVAAPESSARWPPALRPLGMLAMLARRDVRRGAKPWERQGNPARMLRMVRHRLTGY